MFYEKERSFKMNKIFLLSLFCSLFILQTSKSQQTEYARSVVNLLASDSLSGRGYVNSGDKKAAEFIKNEFMSFGLTPLGNDFYQTFETSVNTFPETVTVEIGNQNLKPGTDFLIDPGSPSVNNQFGIIILTARDLLDNEKFISELRISSGKFLAIQPYERSNFSDSENETIKGKINFLKYHPQNPSKGTIILTNDKLTWSGSTRLNTKPTLIIQKDSLKSGLKSITLNFQNKFFKNYSTQNVAGLIKGKNSDSTIVFMAHYDHLGMMGSDATFNGANDNASGIAMLLSMAKYYSENQPEYDMAFIAFGAEELGLIGSKYFIENPLFDLSSVKFFFNFDISGTGDEGIQVVNGSVYKSAFDSLSEINGQKELLPQVKIRGAACNSDHCWFDQKEIPGFYIYTLGGIQAYHDVYDRPETLPLTEFDDYFKLLTLFIAKL